MSRSNQDSAAWFIILAVVLLICLGGAYLAYQSLIAQRLVAEQQALAMRHEAERALVAAKAAEADLAKRMRDELQQRELATSSDIEAKNLESDQAIIDVIQRKLARQQEDWNRGDLDAFMQVYWHSDQLTFASGGKVTRGWQATLDGYKSRYSTKEKLGSLTFGDLEFQRLGDSVALVLGTWHLERGADSVGGNFSLVWKKINEQWVIVHDHTSALPKESSP